MSAPSSSRRSGDVFVHLSGCFQYQALNRRFSSASLEVRVDGKARACSPRKSASTSSFGEPTFQPLDRSESSGLREDLYVVAGSVGGTERSNAITIHPLVCGFGPAGDPGDRRTHDDVALGRATVPAASASTAQAGFEARLVGTESDESPRISGAALTPVLAFGQGGQVDRLRDPATAGIPARPSDRFRQRRGRQGHRAQAQVHLWMQPRHLHLPDHRLPVSPAPQRSDGSADAGKSPDEVITAFVAKHGSRS